jgi:hypothetical protein
MTISGPDIRTMVLMMLEQVGRRIKKTIPVRWSYSFAGLLLITM